MSILQISHVKCDQKSKLLIVKTFTLAFNSSYNYLLLKKRKKKSEILQIKTEKEFSEPNQLVIRQN